MPNKQGTYVVYPLILGNPKYSSMYAKPSRAVTVLIFEEDQHYSDLLARKIGYLNQNTSRLNRSYRVRIEQIIDPESYVKIGGRGYPTDRDTIAFVNDNFKTTIGTISLSRKLLEINDCMKIVILGESEKTLRVLQIPGLNNAIHTVLIKHEYTPEICRIIVEDFIRNL